METETDKEGYQKRLDRITEIFADMVTHADTQASERCPYRNRFDECTAKIHCRNQAPPRPEGELLMCGHDGGFDYRDAWESDPDSYDKAKAKIEKIKKDAPSKRSAKSDSTSGTKPDST
jgi:hypothetical protein